MSLIAGYNILYLPSEKKRFVHVAIIMRKWFEIGKANTFVLNYI